MTAKYDVNLAQLKLTKIIAQGFIFKLFRCETLQKYYTCL